MSNVNHNATHQEDLLPHAAGPWSARLRTEPSRRLLRTMWMSSAVFLAWAALFQVDKVTHATGRVIPSVENQVVQHLEGGIIAEVLVREGERVRAGQVLMRISDQFNTADVNNATTDVVSRQIRLARLVAEIAGAANFEVDPALAAQAPHIAASETGLFSARRSQLNQELAVIDSQIRAHNSEIASIEARLQSLRAEEQIQRERMTLLEAAAARDAASRQEVLDRQATVEQLRTRISDSQTSIPQIRAQAAEAASRAASARARFIAEAEQEAAELRVELAQAEQSLTAFADRTARAEVRAPMDGVIKEIFVQTVGGVIRGGDPLIEITPLDERILIEARLPPQDRADVWPGQEATVKISAYDFATFGGLDALVVDISPDAIQDPQGEAYFRVRLSADGSSFGEDRPVIPGMTADVDIRAGRRTILSYLISPIQDVTERAMRE